MIGAWKSGTCPALSDNDLFETRGRARRETSPCSCSQWEGARRTFHGNSLLPQTAGAVLQEPAPAPHTPSNIRNTKRLLSPCPLVSSSLRYSPTRQSTSALWTAATRSLLPSFTTVRTAPCALRSFGCRPPIYIPLPTSPHIRANCAASQYIPREPPPATTVVPDVERRLTCFGQ